MGSERTGHILGPKSAKPGGIVCDTCHKEFSLLPTAEQIAASHTDGQGYNPPTLQNIGCPFDDTPHADDEDPFCNVSCPRQEVFDYYKQQGHEIRDAALDDPKGPETKTAEATSW